MQWRTDWIMFNHIVFSAYYSTKYSLQSMELRADLVRLQLLVRLFFTNAQYTEVTDEHRYLKTISSVPH